MSISNILVLISGIYIITNNNINYITLFNISKSIMNIIYIAAAALAFEAAAEA